MTITEIEIEAGCTRADYYGTPCAGEVFLRTSASGLTVAPICEGHAAQLEGDLAGIAQRYPEIYHHEDCLCRGCNGDL